MAKFVLMPRSARAEAHCTSLFEGLTDSVSQGLALVYVLLAFSLHLDCVLVFIN